MKVQGSLQGLSRNFTSGCGVVRNGDLEDLGQEHPNAVSSFLDFRTRRIPKL